MDGGRAPQLAVGPDLSNHWARLDPGPATKVPHAARYWPVPLNVRRSCGNLCACVIDYCTLQILHNLNAFITTIQIVSGFPILIWPPSSTCTFATFAITASFCETKASCAAKRCARTRAPKSTRPRCRMRSRWPASFRVRARRRLHPRRAVTARGTAVPIIDQVLNILFCISMPH
jgi:hypothetical protein